MRQRITFVVLLALLFACAGCHRHGHAHPPGHAPSGPGASEHAPGHNQ